MKRSYITLSAALVAALLLPLQSMAKPTTLKDSHDNRESYAPYNKDNFPNNVYFGDTHLHTSYSTDAALFGATIGPDAAYKFAKGELVTASMGTKTRLERPLDFLVVADHAENLGLAPLMTAEDPMVMENEWGKKITKLYKAGDLAKAYAM